ncbi:MAG TPA: helix-turn-helix transcriptional regulator [Solirubrobacteraceae bacterium]|nr:helix-turn-helix transcriptional regulator [Solirubrobacteraceae bacterium]
MRTARNAIGLAQDNLRLKRAKLDKGMVSHLELGVRSPRLTTILRVAKTLEVTPENLLQGIGTNRTVAEQPPRRHDLEQPAARFGANLLWLRTCEGISQEALGQEADLHPVGVGALERGERDPMLKTILRLAWALEVPPAILLHGVQSDQEPDGANGSS